MGEEKWVKGEKILCFHGPLIYEAKIQEVEMQNSIPKYFIHYKGWNKNWDEWVPEARMLKFTDDNVEHQKNLCRAHEAKEASRKRREHVFVVPQAPSPQPKKEKGRRKCGLKPKKREGKGDEFLLQEEEAGHSPSQDDCRSADQRVHADEDNEQGREVEEQQREGNTGGDSRSARIFQCDAFLSTSLQTRTPTV